jgi:hypothetical protein
MILSAFFSEHVASGGLHALFWLGAVFAQFYPYSAVGLCKNLTLH